jgi:hypothetical protein
LVGLKFLVKPQWTVSSETSYLGRSKKVALKCVKKLLLVSLSQSDHLSL